MRRQGRFWRIGPLAGTSTLVAMVATAIVAAPGGAAIPEKEYATSFGMECVVAPGLLNIHAKEQLKVTLAATGPEEVTPGQEVSFHGAHSTIESPVELTESFAALGANEVKGTTTLFVLMSTGVEPESVNIVKPAEFPSGLPFLAPVEKGLPSIFHIPSETLGETGLTYSFGPEKITQTSGNVVVEVNSEPGYTETEPRAFKETGHGIVTAVEGRRSGTHVLGPLKTVCNAPAGVVAASIPVKPPVRTAEYKNWKLAGSITDKKLGQAITLPEGSTFNGSGEVNTETGAGSVKGNVSIPPFTSSLKLFGPVAVSLGLTLSEAGPLEGTVAKSESVPGDETLSAPLKLNAAITSLSILGLTVPTSCATTEPLALGLTDTLTEEELLTKGWSFAGSTSISKVKCEGGFLSGLFGALLSGLVTGREDPYSISVTAPSG
jgi:hypothetical protein